MVNVNSYIDEYGSDLEDWIKELEKREEKISDLEHDIETKDATISEHEAEIERLNDVIFDLQEAKDLMNQ